MRAASLVCAALAVSLLVGCAQKAPDSAPAYEAPPVFIEEIVLTDLTDTLEPVRVQCVDDSLFISYSKLPRIDVYTTAGDRVRKIELVDPDFVFPTSFTVVDSEVIIADHTRGVIAVYDRAGAYKTSWGLLPDHQTKLSPFALTEYGGVLYLTDLSLRKALAISLVDAPGITERGELTLSFPNDTAWSLLFPSALYVTIDGRLLIGDAGSGHIEVFTCDGRYIYRFDTLTTPAPAAPQAFAADYLADPELQDSTTFDPSNVRSQGRIHVADATNGQIHMYSPLGRYVGSYPTDGRLKKPAGITVDKWTRNIYITDPVARRLFVYRIGP